MKNFIRTALLALGLVTMLGAAHADPGTPTNTAYVPPSFPTGPGDPYAPMTSAFTLTPSMGDFLLEIVFSVAPGMSDYLSLTLPSLAGITYTDVMLTYYDDAGTSLTLSMADLSNGVMASSLEAYDTGTFAFWVKGTSVDGMTAITGSITESITPVPEPASASLFALGGVAAAFWTIRRRKLAGASA